MSLLEDLQRAVIAALETDPALQTLMGRDHAVFDTIPAQRKFPFIVVSDVSENPWNTDDSLGTEALLTLRVWSRASNRSELYAIGDCIGSVLDQMPGQHDATRVVLSAPVSAAYERDRGASAFRAILRFRFLLEPSTP